MDNCRDYYRFRCTKFSLTSSVTYKNLVKVPVHNFSCGKVNVQYSCRLSRHCHLQQESYREGAEQISYIAVLVCTCMETSYIDKLNTIGNICCCVICIMRRCCICKHRLSEANVGGAPYCKSADLQNHKHAI